ncbi:hypothetical protein GCM10022236_47650 [Microlunatus ginsengisoli]|uniref:Uncharacterized protein n=1 Tax=Microlunatus ginsengisoli TaxID=363863 RepID=A0ABP7AT84_9ACTN
MSSTWPVVWIVASPQPEAGRAADGVASDMAETLAARATRGGPPSCSEELGSLLPVRIPYTGSEPQQGIRTAPGDPGRTRGSGA